MDNATRPYLSVCIPTYEMHGMGHLFLRESFEKLAAQTYKDFVVVISDYAETDFVKRVCDEYARRLRIEYHVNDGPLIGMAANLNNVIRHASGRLIKILCQDDFLYDEKSLERTVAAFDLEKDNWMVSACEHSKDGTTFFRPFYPRYNKKIIVGNNTISSPSVLTIKNDAPLLFDTNMNWLVDCDYYKRCFDAFGKPKILNTITVVNRIGDHQTTNNEATEALRKKEREYVMQKHQIGRKGKLQLKNVSLVAVSGINPTSAAEALALSLKGVDYQEAVLIAHYKPDNLDPRIVFKKCKDDELVSQDPKNTDDYSKFMLYNLADYVAGEYALIVHKQAVVLRPHQWKAAFQDYDYIGAPWPKDVHFTPEGVNVRVGNGGFSLRSKKMLRALKDLNLTFTDGGTGYFHEDGVICVYYRKKLEEYGIRFAPVHLAAQFALETQCDESDYHPFGYHDNIRALPKVLLARHILKKIKTKL